VGEERRREEGGAAHRVATGAQRPEAVRGRRELELSPSGKDVRVEQSRKQSFAVNAYAEPSSPNRPHLHRRPNVSAANLCSSSLLP
jgi:hypothetical protein